MNPLVLKRKAITKMQAAVIAVIIIIAIIAGVAYYYSTMVPTPTPVTPTPATPTPVTPTPATPTPVSVLIKAGYVVPAENIISLFEIPFFQESVLKDYGKKYKIDLLRLSSTPDLVAALAAGEIQVGHLATISFASAIAKDVVPSGLIIIAGDAFDAYPGYYSFTCLTLTDSPINTVEDLRGKKIGINALGTAVHFAASAVLKAHGIDPKKDVTFVEVGPFTALAPSLKDKKIDAGIFPPAYYWPVIGEGIYKKVFDSKEGFTYPYANLFLCARGDFLAAQKDAIKAFLSDYDRLMEYIYTPENRESVVDVVSKHFGLSKEALARYWLTEKDFYRSAKVDKVGVQYGLTKLFELGFVDKLLDVTPYVYVE